MLTFGMLPKIDRPTRINKNSATLIDNILTNVHQADIESGLWIADISDHLPIFAIIPSSFTKLTKCSGFIHKRIYSAANMNNFHEKLSNTDWSDIHQAPTTQDKYNLFTKIVNDLHENCFPVTKVRTNPTKSKPWITTTILKSIKKKNKMYKKCLTNKSVHLLNSYKKYRNTLTSLIRAAEKSYYSNKLLEVKDNMSKTWKVLNRMTNRSTNKNPINLIEKMVLSLTMYPKLQKNSTNSLLTLGLIWPIKFSLARTLLSTSLKEIIATLCFSSHQLPRKFLILLST